MYGSFHVRAGLHGRFLRMSDGTAPPRRRWTKTNKRILGAAGTIAVVVAVFVFVLPRVADYREVLDVVRELDWQDWLLLIGATLLNLVTFPPPWMAALPGLGFRQALAMTQASTALAIVSPAGAAVGMAGSYSMLRSWGFAAGPVGLAVAVTGIWNQLANLTFPVVALALLTAADEDHPALRTAAIVAVAVLVVVLVSFGLALSGPGRARSIGARAAGVVNRAKRFVRRKPVSWGGESFVRFRAQALGLLRRRWHVITLGTLVGHLTVFVLLVVCLRVVGISAVGGLGRRSLRGMGARSHPRGASPDSSGCRHRRDRPHWRAGRLRSTERRGGDGDPSLPRSHRLSHSCTRNARGCHLAHTPTGGVDRVAE